MKRVIWKGLPSKSLVLQGEEAKGGKHAKDRLTVMLACSAVGDKLQPVVIGRSASPRCFKNIQLDSLPIKWESNRKAWMTCQIFTAWLAHLNNKMKLQGRKILLLFCNAPCHPRDRPKSDECRTPLPSREQNSSNSAPRPRNYSFFQVPIPKPIALPSCISFGGLFARQPAFKAQSLTQSIGSNLRGKTFPRIPSSTALQWVVWHPVLPEIQAKPRLQCNSLNSSLN